MSKIIGVAPNIVDLTLTLDIWSSDTITGLAEGPTNKAATDLLAVATSGMATSWKQLHTVYWPYSIRAYGFGRIAPLLQAIDRPSPAVTFYVQSEFHTMSDLRNLLMSKGVARIVVMTSQPSYRTVPATAILMEQVDADPELSGKVELESAQEIQAEDYYSPIANSYRCPTTSSSIVATSYSNSLAPDIRTCTYRFLGNTEGSSFGFTPDQWSSKIARLTRKLEDFQQKFDNHSASERATEFIRIQKHDIPWFGFHSDDSDSHFPLENEDDTAPRLFKREEFHASLTLSLQIMISARLASLCRGPKAPARPGWRLWQRALRVNSANVKVLDVYFERFKADCSQATSLGVRNLQGSRLFPGEFGYAPIASAHLFKPDVSAGVEPVEGHARPSLLHLTSLRCDEYNSYASIPTVTRKERKTVRSSLKRSTKTSKASTPSAIVAPFLNALRPLSLPALRHLDLRAPLSSYTSRTVEPVAKSAIVKFLTEHGGQLRELAINFASLDMKLLDKIPLLEALILRIEVRYLNPAFFNVLKKHEHLKKILVGAEGDFGWQEKVSDHDIELHKVDFSSFPALEELRVNNCNWPANQRELKKDKEKIAWVKLSERLNDKFGLRLTDGAGVHWVPRLATSGGKRK
ncbi:hypothetical protein BDV98DRAFT_604189 [Pterulicium gracile]|uniref:Uncharacterized protein n=1 Tax=Pterulicium gracile TaxID=1884261 RepID=A0A5C3QJT0_9AGAR|nr:hypothetical protein BDV98DRAFT_604189 [Pterula gracilis]